MQVRYGKGINRSCIDMMVMRIWFRYWWVTVVGEMDGRSMGRIRVKGEG